MFTAMMQLIRRKREAMDKNIPLEHVMLGKQGKNAV